MSGLSARAVQIKAFAKINLDLRVLGRLPDGFHELRTVFQTISVADRLGIEFEPSQHTEITIAGSEIPGNLIETAARLCLDNLRLTARVRFQLKKVIPMGAGLGGGSSDAAAVLLALPALAGAGIETDELAQMAKSLGSDVPFFLMGGAAVGLGRGEELYPLPERKGVGLLVAPGVHVSTPWAYQTLSPRLDPAMREQKLAAVQEFAAGIAPAGQNDFEAVVFEQHPKLELIKSQLLQAGAATALMSGSGSSLFGLFHGRNDALRAADHFREEEVSAFSFVGRQQFRAAWGKWLAPFTIPNTWPPRSRYAQ